MEERGVDELPLAPWLRNRIRVQGFGAQGVGFRVWGLGL